MAQDFGDDMGNALLNFVARQTENYLRFGRGRERAFDWWQRHYKKEGNTPEAAKAIEAGDIVEIDFDSGMIYDKTKGTEYKGQAFPPFMQKIIKAEGLINYINENK